MGVGSDLSVPGPPPSGRGSPVCEGCEGRPGGRGHNGGCVRRNPKGAPNSARLIPLHALQFYSKNGLAYLNREQSFHAGYLTHRYKNAYNSNSRLN